MTTINSVEIAVKDNIRYHFTRWVRNSDQGCTECPFREECTTMVDARFRCLCEVITGKSMGELLGR